MCPIQYPYIFLGFVTDDSGPCDNAVIDFYGCCKREQTEIIGDNGETFIADTSKYCIDSEPLGAGMEPNPEQNPEGVKLLEAEDNHIDKSEFTIFLD